MIEFQQVTKRYGHAVAVQELSLNIEQGEFTMLIGGSGSGKSTTLKMINRMVEHDSGRILFMGEQIRRFKAEELRRRMGYAIQSIGLFPHWTVERNIAAVPALLQWPQARIRERVTELLELLGLSPDAYRGRYPHQLSGGQQQRVGVARALAADPEVLLMDEPFGALDPVTRKALQAEMARIHRVSRKTIVMVTHDIDEALLLGTRVVLMDQGRVVQAGVPADLLVRPHDDAVKAFVGQADLGVRLLGLQQVSDRARPDDHAAAGEPVRSDVSLREALSLFVARSTDRLPVVDPQGRAAGVLHFADLLARPA